MLYFAAFPGVGWWPLGFVAIAPLIIAARGQRLVVAAALGLLSGTLTTFLGFLWLLDTLRIYSGFPTSVCVLLLLLLSLFQGGRMAMFSSVLRVLERNRWPISASAFAAFIVSELVYPLLFPWYLGAVLHDWPLLIQTADVGGPILVGLPMLIVSTVIARCFGALKPTRPNSRDWITAAAALLLPILYGAAMVVVTDARAGNAPPARLGLVQGNVPMPPASAAALHERFAWQLAATRRLAAEGAQLVIWPESAFVHVLPERSTAEAIERTAGSLGVPVLVGALIESDAEPTKTYNTALMIDRKGEVTGRYDKQHLLPFGEYLPLGDRFPGLYRLSPASARISPGPRTGPLPFEDKRVTVAICYEDILPSFVVDAARQHRPHLLVNVTNDGWFGRSWESEIHLSLSKLRAVEHRLYLVRSTNTGQSAVVDPVGRVTARAVPFEAGTLLADVRWMHGWTLFGMWGNAPWWLVTLMAGVGMVLPRRPRA